MNSAKITEVTRNSSSRQLLSPRELIVYFFQVNLGKWVLRYLFEEFTQAEIKAYEESRAFAEQQQQSVQRQQSLNDIHKYTQEALPQSPTLATPPHHISFPPATMQAE